MKDIKEHKPVKNIAEYDLIDLFMITSNLVRSIDGFDGGDWCEQGALDALSEIEQLQIRLATLENYLQTYLKEPYPRVITIGGDDD